MTKSKKPVSQNVENDLSNINEVVDPAQLGLGLEGAKTAAPPTPPIEFDSEKMRQAAKLDLDAACAFLHLIKVTPGLLEMICDELERLHKSAGPLIDHMKVQKDGVH